jgi:hypothetical protein
MALDIFEIDGKSAKKLAREYSSLGIGEDIERMASQVVSDLSNLGLAALQTASPIATGELRNEHIHTKSSDFRSVVYIDSRVHDASEAPKPKADALAQILNIGDYQRSQNSDTAPPFSVSFGGLTTGWLDEAIKIFDAEEVTTIGST